MLRILRNLMRMARNGTIRGSSHSCAIISNKRVVSYGVNTTRTYRKVAIQQRLGIVPSEHAEANALFNMKMKKRTTLIALVIRILKNGRLALSKPCVNCRTLLIKYGIKYIMYSTDSGIIMCEKIRGFTTDHESRGFRKTIQ